MKLVAFVNRARALAILSVAKPISAKKSRVHFNVSIMEIIRPSSVLHAPFAITIYVLSTLLNSRTSTEVARVFQGPPDCRKREVLPRNLFPREKAYLQRLYAGLYFAARQLRGVDHLYLRPGQIVHGEQCRPGRIEIGPRLLRGLARRPRSRGFAELEESLRKPPASPAGLDGATAEEHPALPGADGADDHLRVLVGHESAFWVGAAVARALVSGGNPGDHRSATALAEGGSGGGGGSGAG
mmetsp:Transcript_12884/g.28458  ORF Transcript_12884/g.28458 Transcript_12884/m.28458 type:complete len:241 (-) Transcript_12884:214-936(-)